MKKIKLIILICLLVFLSGCSKNSQEDQMTEWLSIANLQETETSEELYEKALKEKTLTIYTVSSRILDVAASFEEEYPELLVEVIYTRITELNSKIIENASQQTFDCDLIFCSNGDGTLTENLIPNNYVYRYVPNDISDKLITETNDAYLSVLLEVALLVYNDRLYDTPPVSNWWELTEPQWKDKVFITDPNRSMISYTLFSSMLQREDELALAYEAYYDEPFSDEEGAGKAYLRKLVDNGLNIVNDSNDVAEAIGRPGLKDSAIGIMNASKMRMRDTGYDLMAIYEMSPYVGVVNPASIMMVGGSENINSAKLFIRWIMGETDGLSEGYKPFLQNGTWSSRSDVKTQSEVSLEDISVIYTDETFTSQNRENFLEFWGTLTNNN